MALEPGIQAMAIEKIHQILNRLVHRRPVTLADASEIDPAVAAAFDELVPDIVKEALRRERESRKPPEKSSPIPVVDGYSSLRK